MVYGLNSFKTWFADCEEQYVIIGGTACDILMSEDGRDFRATKDIDMVLIVEAITPEFGCRFWKYIQEGEYQNRYKNTGKPELYRFISPGKPDFPSMIELFSTTPDNIVLPSDAVLTPVPLNNEIPSLSAILLDKYYYSLFNAGRVVIDGVPILDAGYLLILKAKAWLDLSARCDAGEHVDQKNIKKHRNDVFRLSTLLTPETRISVSKSVHKDLSDFLTAIENDLIDIKQLGISGRSQDEIFRLIRNAYIEE